MNLAAIILCVTHSRLIVENLLKYGLLVVPPKSVSQILREVDYSRWPMLSLLLFFNFNIFAALFIELLAARSFRSKRKVPEVVFFLLNFINILCSLAVPCYFVTILAPNPAEGACVILTIMCGFFKLISFAHVNWELRTEEENKTVHLSSNLNRYDERQAEKSEKLLSSEHCNKTSAGRPLTTTRLRKLDRNRSTTTKSWEKEIDKDVFQDSNIVEKEILLRLDSKSTNVKYPNNLTISQLYYFIAVPTLVYELEYPKSPSIRFGWLVRRIFELIFFSLLIVSMAAQWVLPTLINSFWYVDNLLKTSSNKPFSSEEISTGYSGVLKEKIDLFLNGTNPADILQDPSILQSKFPTKESAASSLISILHIVERVLKISVPNLYIWLLGFYCIFHLYLNILAEITRFGDRHFYRDWWNARNLDFFWRNWNMPIHHWLKRHIYNPLIVQGCPQKLAIGAVFFVSAVGHELAVGVPLGLLPYYLGLNGTSNAVDTRCTNEGGIGRLPLAFFAMLAQLPLCVITRNIFRKSQFGNVVFWVSIMLGQPFAVVFYHYDYAKRNCLYDLVEPKIGL
eukprot:g1011.t1